MMKKFFDSQSVAFDPDVIDILVHALEDACIVADAEGLLTGNHDDSAVTRELLAKKIEELAREGERDPAKLIVRSLQHLADSKAKSSE
jgi:hypothetical protein